MQVLHQSSDLALLLQDAVQLLLEVVLRPGCLPAGDVGKAGRLEGSKKKERNTGLRSSLDILA